MKRQSTKSLWESSKIQEPISTSIQEEPKEEPKEELPKSEEKLIRQTIVLEIDTKLFWTLCFIGVAVLFLALVVLFSTVQNLRILSKLTNAARNA